MRDEFDEYDFAHRKPPVPRLALFTGALWVLLGQMFLLFAGLNGILILLFLLLASSIPGLFGPNPILSPIALVLFCNMIVALALGIGLFFTGIQTVLGTNKKIEKSNCLSFLLGLLCLASAVAELIFFKSLPFAGIMAGLAVGLLITSLLGYACTKRYNQRRHTIQWREHEYNQIVRS